MLKNQLTDSTISCLHRKLNKIIQSTSITRAPANSNLPLVYLQSSSYRDSTVHYYNYSFPNLIHHLQVELLRYIVLFCSIYQDLFHCRLSRQLRISKTCSLNRSELQDVLKKLPVLTAQYPVSSGKTPLITLAKLSANCFLSV